MFGWKTFFAFICTITAVGGWIQTTSPPPTFISELLFRVLYKWVILERLRPEFIALFRQVDNILFA